MEVFGFISALMAMAVFFALPLLLIIGIVVLVSGSLSSSAKRKGATGERMVARVLSNLGPEYRVINDIVISNKNGNSTQLDHVVVSPYGIFVIETKNYKGWIFGYENAKQWTQTIYKRKDKFLNPIIQNKGHIRALSYLLKKQKYFHSIIVFGNEATFKFNDSFDSAEVVYMRQLATVVRKHNEKVFTDTQVSEMYQAIIGAAKSGEEVSQKHVASLNERKYNRKQKVANKVCPHCGGNLVERKGKYGSFTGCSNFPRCKFKG
ncbi:NERD domain-containing protein (plasmid) [Rossellomorea sp. AcN35-11]|nr:NERD domain-containing protein [Rossellomorea aquimaris]WJV31962.1 NERD domain-containing protein [Rossellomorea sp. AcN35-11]